MKLKLGLVGLLLFGFGLVVVGVARADGLAGTNVGDVGSVNGGNVGSTDVAGVGNKDVDIADDLEIYVHEVTKFYLGFHGVCNTEIRGMEKILNDSGVTVELNSITSGTLPKDMTPEEFLVGLVKRARAYIPRYNLDRSFIDDMRTIFIATGIKGSRIFFVLIPKWENEKADSFCFGEWVQ